MKMASKSKKSTDVRDRRGLAAIKRELAIIIEAVRQIQQDVGRLAYRDHVMRNALVKQGLVAPDLIDVPVELPETAMIH